MPVACCEGEASGPPGLAATGTIRAPENLVDSRVLEILLVIWSINKARDT